MSEHLENKRDLSRLVTVGQLLGSTGAITVYTCPAHFETEVQLLLVNNLHTGVVDLTVKGVISSTNVPIVTTNSMAKSVLCSRGNSLFGPSATGVRPTQSPNKEFSCEM